MLLSVYARGFMATPVIGNVNLGTIMGLLQFATTFLITWLYIRHMNKHVDPIATRIREELEGASPVIVLESLGNPIVNIASSCCSSW